MGKVIDFAKKRLAEEIEANSDANIRYWVAYLDGARAQYREDNKVRENEVADKHKP